VAPAFEHSRSTQPLTERSAVDLARAIREQSVTAERVRAGGDLPPLLGVPCTIKESFALTGMPNCAGLVSRRTGAPIAMHPRSPACGPPARSRSE